MSLTQWLTVSLLTFPLVAQAFTVNLGWDPPEAGTPTGYAVERKRGVNDTWGALALPTNPTGLVYTNSFDDGEWPVCYRVIALYGATVRSEPSNELCFPRPDPARNLTGRFEGTFSVTFTPTGTPPKP